MDKGSNPHSGKVEKENVYMQYGPIKAIIYLLETKLNK